MVTDPRNRPKIQRRQYQQPPMLLNYERLNLQLMKVVPETRLEQTCDTKVMFRIKRDHSKFSVHYVIAYAFVDTTSKDNLFNDPGACAAQSRAMVPTDVCMIGPRNINSHELKYEIGK